MVEPLKPLSPAAGPVRIATGEAGPFAGRPVTPPSSRSDTVSRLDLRLVGVAGEELIVEGGGRRLLLAGGAAELAALRRAVTVGRSTLSLLLPPGGEAAADGSVAARLVAVDGEPLDLAVSLRRAPGPERAAAAGPSPSDIRDTSGPAMTAGTRPVFEATIPGTERPTARLTVVLEAARPPPAPGAPPVPAVAPGTATPAGTGSPAPTASPLGTAPPSTAPPRAASSSSPATAVPPSGGPPPGTAASPPPSAGTPAAAGTVPPAPGARAVAPARPAPMAVAPTPAGPAPGSPAGGAERPPVAAPTNPFPAPPAVAAAPATAGPAAPAPAPTVTARMPAFEAGARIPATVIGHDPGGRLVLRLPGSDGGSILRIEERGLDIPPGSRITLRVDRVLEAEAGEISAERASPVPAAPGPASATTVAMADRDAALRLFAYLLRRAAPEVAEKPAPAAAKAEGTASPAPPTGTPGSSAAGSVVWLGGGGAPPALRIGERAEAGSGDGEDGGRRWTFALELAAFGAMRLELWARHGSRQLAVRSERPLPEEVRRLIADTFGAALEISGNRGWLIFTGLAAATPQEDPATRGLLA